MATHPGLSALLRHPATAWVAAVAIVSAAALLGLPWRDTPATAAMLCLTGVVVTAARFGTGPAVLASVLATAAFNLLYVRPYGSLLVQDHRDYAPLGVMLLTALIVGALTSRAARRAREARDRENQARHLLEQAIHRAAQAQSDEQVRHQAEQEKLRSLLLASISHDLRTPLTVLTSGLGQVLRLRRKLPRETVDDVTGLIRHTERLQHFVENLLRMAALTSGELKLNRQPYLIQEIIGAALGRIESHKGGRNLRTVTTGPLPLISLDGALIEQVLINLLDNALRHTPDDGTVTVSVQGHNSGVAVSVANTGPPLPEGLDLFRRFESGGNRSGGSGLGLAICRGIVEAHGGTISAQSLDDPSGARFTFTLPGTP